MSLKRKLTQDDLRKAMSEHKKKLGAVKKIESPLAKYPFYHLIVKLEVSLHLAYKAIKSKVTYQFIHIISNN